MCFVIERDGEVLQQRVTEVPRGSVAVVAKRDQPEQTLAVGQVVLKVIIAFAINRLARGNKNNKFII